MIVAPSSLEIVKNIPDLFMFFSNFAISFFPENGDRLYIFLLLRFVLHFTYLPFLNATVGVCINKKVDNI